MKNKEITPADIWAERLYDIAMDKCNCAMCQVTRMMMEQETSKAIKKVYNKLSKMPKKEFMKKLEKHKNGDIAKIMRETRSPLLKVMQAHIDNATDGCPYMDNKFWCTGASEKCDKCSRLSVGEKAKWGCPHRKVHKRLVSCEFKPKYCKVAKKKVYCKEM